MEFQRPFEAWRGEERRAPLSARAPVGVLVQFQQLHRPGLVEKFQELDFVVFEGDVREKNGPRRTRGGEILF